MPIWTTRAILPALALAAIASGRSDASSTGCRRASATSWFCRSTIPTSFRVPFGAIAAAMDQRLKNVAFIYGAGNLPQVFAANLKGVPSLLRRPLASLAMFPFAPFAPERFVQRIAPRQLVMINGADDPRMPLTAVHTLYDAAGDPKLLILLKTGHLLPT